MMTTLEMENVLSLPVERKILWVEDVWDSICSQPESVPVLDSHKKELDRRVDKYRKNPSALITENQLKESVASRGSM